jgi:hypothetical protein
MRLANAYFLVVCVFQSIPQISITNGVPTSALPLGIVLLFDGFATAREDYKRHVDDKTANNSKSAWGFLRAGPPSPLRHPCVVPPFSHGLTVTPAPFPALFSLSLILSLLPCSACGA